MPQELTWDSVEDIGLALLEKFPTPTRSLSASPTCTSG